MRRASPAGSRAAVRRRFEPPMDTPFPLPDLTAEHLRRIAAIAASYQRLTGRALVDGAASAGEGAAGPSAGTRDAEIAAALWAAPLAIVAHGTEADPVFFFGNRVALRLFEMDFAAFTRLPSRFSAEPLLREERSRLLERVTRDGIILDYAGVRVSSTGRRFRIENAAVWNLADGTGEAAGQAAAFAEWVELER